MKMKFLIALVSFSVCNVLSGQIKIGDNPQNIDASSVLELESSNRVFVVTRINTSQMNSIVPSQGAIVYNTDEQCLYFYDGASWLNMCETFGLTFTADPIVNPTPTIVITETGDNRNFEVGEITGANITDFSISGNDIQNNSITSDKLAPDSVGSEELQTNTVADDEIDYNQVTLNDFNNDAGFITGAEIVSPDPNNSITDNTGAFYDDTPLQNDIAANTAAIAADGDTDATNEIQNLALAGNNLTISGANTVDLGVFNNAGTDEQDLTGATLSGANILQIDIENGASATVDLTPLSGTGTDNQNLTAATLSPANILQIDIEDGTSASVDLSGLSGTGTDNQQLTLTGGNILTLEDGGTVDLNPFLDNTDDQNITNFVFDDLTNVLTITLEDGNTQTVDLTALATGAGTDDQQLTLTGGNILTLEDGGTVDLNLFLDNTDDQTITNFAFDDLTNVLTITLEDGNTQTVDLTALATAAGTDDQVAAEVPFTAYLSITSPNVQGAVVQLKDELDAVVVAGGGNPIDELQDLQLAGNILSLTNPATVGNNVDLTGIIDDADADPVNEIQNITSGDGSVVITPAGIDFDLSVAAGSDDQNIQGSGLAVETLTIGIENGTSQDVSLASFALETELAAAIAASDAADGDTDDTNEIQNLVSGDGSVAITPAGTGFDLSVPAGSDNQNIQGSGLAVETLTIGIENGTSQDVSLAPFALETELAAAIAASDAADGDTDDTNEIQNLVSGDGSVAITPAGTGFDLSVPAGSDNQNIQGSGLAVETLTIGIENGTSQDVSLAPFALETELAVAIAASEAADGDTDDTNEIQNLVSGDGSVAITPAGIGFDLSVPGGSDDQNIQGSGLAGELLTIGIEDGTGENVNLAAFALETEVTASIAVSDAADGDTDDTNEIQTITSTDGSVTLIQTGDDYDLSVAGGSTDDQNLTSATLTGTNLTIAIEDGNPAIADLSGLATDAELAALNVDDADANPNNEIQAITSTDGSVTLVQTGDDYDLSVAGGSTDDQNLTSATLTGTNLTIAIEDGNPAIADLSGLATDAELAALNVDDADANPNNEIQAITSTDGSVTLVQTGDDYDLSVATGGNNLANTNLIQTGGNRIYNLVNQDLAFLNGDIGIGTPAPSATLHVAGSLQLNDVFIDGDGDAGTPGQILSSTGVETDWVDPPAGAVSTGITITGDGTPGNVLDVADGGITAVKIAVGAISGGAGGAIVDNSITASDLQPDSVDASEIRIDAVGSSEIADDAVTTTEILNGTILNADIDDAAAIDGTKINPDFGTQTIITTGGLSVGADILLNGNAVIPDYVFQKYFLESSDIKESYNFSSLEEIEAFVKKNHHLPGIKSAKEVQKDGFWNLSESNLQNLEKIEELFLHTINQEKKINELETKNQSIIKELDTLKKELAAIKNLIKENN